MHGPKGMTEGCGIPGIGIPTNGVGHGQQGGGAVIGAPPMGNVAVIGGSIGTGGAGIGGQNGSDCPTGIAGDWNGQPGIIAGLQNGTTDGGCAHIGCSGVQQGPTPQRYGPLPKM